MDGETIVALATPPGRAGIAVIRVSGNRTREIIKGMVKGKSFKYIPKMTQYCHFYRGDDPIDDGMLTYFKQPFSFTGEDVAEFSIHSNPFIIDRLLNSILQLGARQAMAGEFSYRAFQNGKMDLIQAESINELIQSNSRLSSRMKFSNLEGKLSELMGRIRNLLTRLGIVVESAIEFGEDQHMETLPIVEDLHCLMNYLKTVLRGARFNEILDKGFRVVIAGKVNVGKSSIFNDIILEDRSIVSSVPGTTRDFIDKKIYLNGFAYEITDIAGFNRNTSDSVEDEGIRRSIDMVRQCHATIFVIDSSRELDEDDMQIYDLIKGKKHIIVANKADCSDPEKWASIQARFSGKAIHWISVKQGTNTEVIPEFLKSLTEDIQTLEADISVNKRQKTILSSLVSVLDRVLTESTDVDHSEIVAEEIRTALNLIGELTGEISSEEILDGIFSTFCIGK